MGYSCTKAAADMLQAINQAHGEFADEYSSGRHKFGSNVMLNASALPIGFFERGREQRDGAITGTVMKSVDKYGKPELLDDGSYAIRAGSFKIDADGNIVRFPMLLPNIKKRAAEIVKSGRFTLKYGSAL